MSLHKRHQAIVGKPNFVSNAVALCGGTLFVTGLVPLEDWVSRYSPEVVCVLLGAGMLLIQQASEYLVEETGSRLVERPRALAELKGLRERFIAGGEILWEEDLDLVKSASVYVISSSVLRAGLLEIQAFLTREENRSNVARYSGLGSDKFETFRITIETAVSELER